MELKNFRSFKRCRLYTIRHAPRSWESYQGVKWYHSQKRHRSDHREICKQPIECCQGFRGTHSLHNAIKFQRALSCNSYCYSHFWSWEVRVRSICSLWKFDFNRCFFLRNFQKHFSYNPMANDLLTNAIIPGNTMSGSGWCIFVYNLAPETEDNVLWQLFGPFGAVQSVKVGNFLFKFCSLKYLF